MQQEEELVRSRRYRRTTRTRQRRRATTPRKLLLVGTGLLGIAILAIALVIFADNRTSAATPSATAMTPQKLLVSTNMRLRFDTLNQANTDFCANIGNQPAIYTAMADLPRGSYLQGSCCNPMDFQHYQKQIAALKAYASIPQIAADPYNMPASLANSLMQDDQRIALTPAQQAVYNQASGMTDDHGWCCCQCWAWYTHSGLAKYLITTRNFSAAQVVTVTNVERRSANGQSGTAPAGSLAMS